MRNFDGPPVMLPPDAPGRIYPTQAERGQFNATAVTDNVHRIYAFQRVADLPLVANFGVPMSAVWRDWTISAGPVIALFVLMGLYGFVSAERIRRDMIARFETESNLKRVAAAERLAEERARLMRETNHRVKNNLALVISLINMQMRGKAGIDGNALKTRIGAISHVHDLMYQASDAVHVDAGGLLRDIATSPAIVPAERGVEVHCAIEEGILLGPDRTTPLSLIAAELLTNAVKHAFADHRGGRIDLSFRRDGDMAELRIADDGVGLDAQPLRHSGSAIVDALVTQIGGTLERDGTRGTAVTLRFAIA
jgi:two-component sensor histidine kinase